MTVSEAEPTLLANMHGQVIAVQLLIQGLCSIGLGPVLVGAVNDTFFNSGEMLGKSLFVIITPISSFGIAFCLFRLNARAYARLAAP